MRVTRRQALAGAAAGALGAAGIYELVDRLAGGGDGAGVETLRRTAARMGADQHSLGLTVVLDNGVEVVVPPRHHRLVTAKIAAEDPRKAAGDLEEALAALEHRFDPTTPAGLGVTIGWGVPYFHDHVASQAKTHFPFDRRARKAALIDAIRFPSDPAETILEANDVAVLLRADARRHILEGSKALFDDLDVFRVTSIRDGFAGGGLPKRMAVAAGVPGADLIPEGAQLFLGFTSTQKEGLGPNRIANFETLGYVDLGPRGYFRGGTHMHVSHLFEDLEAWYLNFDFSERVDTAFRPGLKVKPGTQTVRQGPHDVSHTRQVARDFRDTGRIGHSAAIQTASRLQQDIVADDGTVYRRGTAIPQRADFNTLDNPFSWSSDPERDGIQDRPRAGVHFVVFNPTSDDFHRNRLAMDGRLPDGTKLPLRPRARGQGFNAVLRTTHRQNFLVPPRRYRSFPLAEL
jgi:hypothetical protein